MRCYLRRRRCDGGRGGGETKERKKVTAGVHTHTYIYIEIVEGGKQMALCFALW
jgi:hypothetical protein